MVKMTCIMAVIYKFPYISLKKWNIDVKIVLDYKIKFITPFYDMAFNILIT